MPSAVDTFREWLLAPHHARPYYINEPATEQAIRQFEATYQCKLPAVVEEYFLKINGFVDMGWIADLWSLDKIKPMYPRKDHFLPESQKYFIIGDYQVASWWWLVDLGESSKGQVMSDADNLPYKVIAESFEDLLIQYQQTNGGIWLEI